MYLFGASGHGKVIKEIVEANGDIVEGFIDNNAAIFEFKGCKVFHEKPKNVQSLIISIGNNIIRKKIAKELESLIIEPAVHPDSNISNSALIGVGTVVMAGATINADSVIGKNVIINTNASIDHDCIIEDYVHISPNAALAGNVTVKEGAHIGIGACVIQGVIIGKWSVIGAGAVVIKNVPDGVTVVGNPAKAINKG